MEILIYWNNPASTLAFFLFQTQQEKLQQIKKLQKISLNPIVNKNMMHRMNLNVRTKKILTFLS